MKTILLVVTVAAFLSSCSDLGENPGDVYVVVGAQTISINNTSNRPIHVIVMGANVAMLANWAPICEGYNEISSGSTWTFSHSDMTAEGERFAIIYWWNDCKEANGHLLGQDIHGLRVALP